MRTFVFLLLTGLLHTVYAKLSIPETPFTEYTFEARQCKLIQHNESRIFVPAYTFYLDNEIYTGQVTLKYREFTDQLDIIINKIPMNYSENNKQHILESGGMFELFAYGNGKQLSFGTDKKISVQLASNFNLKGGETFILDRKKNTWYKDTPFGNRPESNLPMTDNSADLWGDNIWQENGDSFNPNAEVVVLDADGTTWLTRTETFKTIQVDKMELYNCDRILNEQTVPIVAEFSLEGYKQSLNSEIFVVYKNRNAVLNYFPAQFTTDFKLLPNEPFTIFSIAKDGKVAVLDSDFIRSFDATLYANKKVVFPMKVYSKLPATKDELAAITGI
jgi:hypothetical protein